MSFLPASIRTGFGNLASAVRDGASRLLGRPQTQPTDGRAFRPIHTRPATPDLPHQERVRANQHADLVRPLRRTNSAAPDAPENVAARVDQAAQRPLEAARMQLRRLEDDPTVKKKQVPFTVDFGTTIVNGQPVEHKINLLYRVRHNGVVAPGQVRLVKAQADQTRLVLQKFYNDIVDNDDLKADEKHRRLSILRDIKHYEVSFGHNDEGEVRLKLRVVNSEGKALEHVFKENIVISDQGEEKTVHLENYAKNATEIVHVAAKEVKGFGKMSGFDFFQRLILAGGIPHHALSPVDPRLQRPAAPNIAPNHVPSASQLNREQNALRNLNDDQREALRQQHLRDQQNERLQQQVQRQENAQPHPHGVQPPVQ